MAVFFGSVTSLRVRLSVGRSVNVKGQEFIFYTSEHLFFCVCLFCMCKNSPYFGVQKFSSPEEGIYKRKERKHALDQEKSKIQEKEEKKTLYRPRKKSKKAR